MTSLDLTETNEHGEEWWALMCPSSKYRGDVVYLTFMTLEEVQAKVSRLKRDQNADWICRLASEVHRSPELKFVVDGGCYGKSIQRGRKP